MDAGPCAGWSAGGDLSEAHVSAALPAPAAGELHRDAATFPRAVPATPTGFRRVELGVAQDDDTHLESRLAQDSHGIAGSTGGNPVHRRAEERSSWLS